MVLHSGLARPLDAKHIGEGPRAIQAAGFIAG